MGTLLKRSQKSSSEDKESDNPDEYADEILDLLTNSRILSSSETINSPVSASDTDKFLDLVEHSASASEANILHKKSQKTSTEETPGYVEKSDNGEENGTTPRKKGTKTNIIHKKTQKTSTEETLGDVEKSDNGEENDTAPRKKGTNSKKTRGSQSPRRVTRSASKFRELSSSKHETKDFFESLNWYESKKSYYDTRLQVVLNDFAPSETSDTSSGKHYYDYLLLDSRISGLTEWPGFIRAIFYVGKGKNQRAFDHTKEAAKIWAADGNTCTSKKVSRILDIWRGDGAVIVLTAADDLVEFEALTREALVIETLGKQRLCNKNYGSFYGVAAVLTAREKHELGATLLVKARERFIKVGAERAPAPIKLKKQLERGDESEKVYQEFDNAVLTALMTESNSEAQKTKRI